MTDSSARDSPDVAAELDQWLALRDGLDVVTAVNMNTHRALVQRARDEIVALRERLASLRELSGPILDLIRIKQAEALEQVAQIMDLHSDKVITGTFLAWAIRALKDKRDE